MRRNTLLPTCKVLAAILCIPLVLNAEGNTFTKVRYLGGSISTKVKSDDWDNKLTVTSDAITLMLKDGQSIGILPKLVTSLSYGQEAHRRVGTAVLIGMFSLGIGALSALHKTKLHFIGVNFNDEAGKKQGILLQGDKDNFRAIVVALQGVTGVPVSVAEKERSELPAGVATQVTKNEEGNNEKPTTEAAATATVSTDTSAVGTIAVTSNPDGAEIYSDDAFIGNAPATLKLAPGKHTIRVAQAGYKDWSREITVQASSEAHLAATLEKQN